MSKIMDKVTTQRKTEICNKLQEVYDSLEEAIEIFNQYVDGAWVNVETAINNYNEAISDANEWQSGVATEIQDLIESKSEKWQEGDKGQAYTSWKEQYEEELEAIELEKPDKVSFDGDNPSELLDQKPEEPE